MPEVVPLFVVGVGIPLDTPGPFKEGGGWLPAKLNVPFPIVRPSTTADRVRGYRVERTEVYGCWAV